MFVAGDNGKRGNRPGQRLVDGKLEGCRIEVSGGGLYEKAECRARILQCTWPRLSLCLRAEKAVTLHQRNRTELCHITCFFVIFHVFYVLPVITNVQLDTVGSDLRASTPLLLGPSTGPCTGAASVDPECRLCYNWYPGLTRQPHCCRSPHCFSFGSSNLPCLEPHRSHMESVWVALDLRMQNSESADPRDGSFVMVRSPTTFGNKR